jgi:hypothetical protein
MALAEMSGVIVTDAGVRVTGTVEPARDPQGRVVPRTTPVQFHFLVVQDGGNRWVSGQAETLERSWAGTATGGPGVQLGPAQACGLAVVARESPKPAFETFAWFEQIEVTS